MSQDGTQLLSLIAKLLTRENIADWDYLFNSISSRNDLNHSILDEVHLSYGLSGKVIFESKLKQEAVRMLLEYSGILVNEAEDFYEKHKTLLNIIILLNTEISPGTTLNNYLRAKIRAIGEYVNTDRKEPLKDLFTYCIESEIGKPLVYLRRHRGRDFYSIFPANMGLGRVKKVHETVAKEYYSFKDKKLVKAEPIVGDEEAIKSLKKTLEFKIKNWDTIASNMNKLKNKKYNFLSARMRYTVNDMILEYLDGLTKLDHNLDTIHIKYLKTNKYVL